MNENENENENVNENERGESRLQVPRRDRVAQSRANPGDPPVKKPPITHRGVMPGPNYLGLPGRTAIVQGQVFLVALILIAQLWLVTAALYELLSGRTQALVGLALLSGLGFVLALIITFWPRRRITES
jgi:hypothetical protein